MALKQLVSRTVDVVRRVWNGHPADYDRTVTYDWMLDSYREQITRRINFSRLETIIEGGKNGELADALQLFEEMEERDLRLQGLANTRRRAVTMLDYEIVSAAEVLDERVDRKKADAAADYVRTIVDSLPGWAQALEHLATATGPNLAVLEVVWAGGAPVEIFAVPSRRLRMELTQSDHVRVTTRDDRVGQICTAPKFIVHIPDSRSGSPICRSLSSAQGWIWLLKKLALSDWGTFAEIFGMPVRVGRYDASATPEEKAVLKDMLTNLGPSGWAMMSKAIEIEFAESSGRGTSPHEALVNFANREMAVAWLGGNLTSDTTGGTGTHAAASEQNELRDDLRDDDIKREARTVRDQFFTDVVRLWKPNDETPVPYFRRIKPETVDRQLEATLIGQAQRIGISVPADWAYGRLNIPKPKDGEEVLEPVDAFEAGIVEGTGGNGETSKRQNGETDGDDEEQE